MALFACVLAMLKLTPGGQPNALFDLDHSLKDIIPPWELKDVPAATVPLCHARLSCGMVFLQVCNMHTIREMHKRYHDATGVTFATLYPGCIAETGLFRNHVKAFQLLFPAFQKNITQGYVSEDEAGRRLAAVVGDTAYNKSGVYWSWSNDSEAFVNTPSSEVSVRCYCLNVVMESVHHEGPRLEIRVIHRLYQTPTFPPTFPRRLAAVVG
jgi:hypothetical protein